MDADIDHEINLDGESSLAGAASGQTLSEETFQRLLETGTPEDLKMVAQDANTPEEFLERLAEGPPPEMTERLDAMNSEEHGGLSDTEVRWNRSVYSKLATNPNIPVNALLVVARDAYPYVREEIGKNPSTPDQVLWKLAKTCWGGGTCWAIAQNPRLQEGKEHQDLLEYALIGASDRDEGADTYNRQCTAESRLRHRGWYPKHGVRKGEYRWDPPEGRELPEWYEEPSSSDILCRQAAWDEEE